MTSSDICYERQVRRLGNIPYHVHTNTYEHWKSLYNIKTAYRGYVNQIHV